MPRKFDFVSPGVQITEIDQSKIEAPLQDDGLLVVGRATTGPAGKPIKVNSLENFIDVFGKPISGKGTINDDVWRDGNNQGPTYAMYAAQAWLASNTSPVTFVRLLGEDATNQASGYVKAGWDLGGAQLLTTPHENNTAYGLWVMPSASATTNATGTLAAIIYTTASALTLEGTIAGLPGSTTASANVLIQSISTAAQPATFKLNVHTSTTQDGSVAESLVFHFDPDQKEGYIRNVLNTNPQKINTTNYGASQVKNYFLGESYEEGVNRLVLSTDLAATAGKQYGILLPLQRGAAAANNLLFHQASAAASKTGWFITRDPDPQNSPANYMADEMKKLFRLVSLSEGDYFERNYYVTIEDITLGSVKNPNSTFSVMIRNLAGDIVEQFSNMNLDEASADFIGKKIGDMYQQWDTDKERYEMYGEYPNQSNYVYVEMADDWKANIADAYKVPFGFFGPTRPNGFTIISGSADGFGVQPYAFGVVEEQSTSFATTYVTGGGVTIPYNTATDQEPLSFISQSVEALTASFEWPRLKLSEENTARNSQNYLATDTFGLRQKIASKNDSRILSDRGYIDLFRYQGGGIDLHTAGTGTSYSFVFSLDDIVKSSGKYYWASGSHIAGTAETALNGTQALLSDGVRKFAAPFFGGFNGLDITQVDPFANETVLKGKDETTSYANYSISKAIKAISDSEVVQYDVVSVPGLIDETLSNQLISAVEDRGDALAIIDLDDSYLETFENNGTLTTGGKVSQVLSTARTRDLNTSYAATYYPRVRMRDTLSGNGDVFVAPASVAALGALAFSDANSEGPWFAPAGFNRGGISILGGNDGPRVVGTWKNLPKSDRDELYELNINPIARFPAVGEIVIFGQKTLQQTPSALDRINVRRLMVYLKKRVGAIADTILFDQNVQATWSRFKSSADLLLADVQARFGITEYKLVLDETTTTPSLVDQNILYAKIFVKPARAIEFIAIDFVITRSGVQF